MTILTVGTGGMYDQRFVGGNDVPRPVQWHRITIHNESIGNYAVRQLVKEYVSFPFLYLSGRLCYSFQQDFLFTFS